MLRLPPIRISHIAVAAALVTVFSVGLKPVVDPDFWWHLATGRWMVEHGAIPFHDVFSLTAQSHRWITHEWLTELLFYGAWKIAGAPFLTLLTALVITACFSVVYLAARERGAPPLVCAPIVLLAALASAHTWGARPQMLSMLLTAILVLAISRMVVRSQEAPPLWLAALMLLWVNLHGGFIFGLAVIGLGTAGHVLQGLCSNSSNFPSGNLNYSCRPVDSDSSFLPASLNNPDRPVGNDSSFPPVGLSHPVHSSEGESSFPEGSSIPPARHLATTRAVDLRRSAMVVALSAAACLCNPNGLAGALYPLSYLGNNASTRYIAEWVSPDFHQPQYLFFEGLLLLILAAAMAARHRPRLADVLLLLPFTYFAFDSVRNISLFAVIAAPIAAEMITSLLPETWLAATRRPVAPSRAALNSLAAAVITLAVALPSVSARTSNHAEQVALASDFPTGALQYIQRHGLPARGFDSYNWGGYLIWSLFPSKLVYVDGRPDMYGDRFMDQYIAAYNGDASWRTLFRRDRLCYALIEPSSGIARALAADHGWKVRYHDARAALYIAMPGVDGCRG